MEGSKVQLRSQLLSSETGLAEDPSVNTVSGFAANGRQQHPGMPQTMSYTGQPQMNEQYANDPRMGGYNQGYVSNHDLVTPVLESAGQHGGASSRKASMNSMSMQRLFRRKGNPGGQFDDDKGADLGEIPYADMSFNDIKHLRGSGRYNTSASANIDTAPIIPIVGMPGSDGAKSLNNVQYRKYMNHQKKMNLAQSARAMSLASGGNPMANQDPRAMSFTNNPGSRANSLGNVLNNGPNSRAMSLNSNAMLRGSPAPGPGQMYPQGPVSGPMFQRGPMVGSNPQFYQPQGGQGGQAYAPQQGGYFQGRPLNVNHAPNQMQMAGPGSYQGMPTRNGAQQYNGSNMQDPRANSLSSNSMPMSAGMGGASGPRMQSMTSGQGYPTANQRYANGTSTLAPPSLHHNSPQVRASGGDPVQYPQSSRGPGSYAIETSTDSLTNVMEEEEEEEISKGHRNSKSIINDGSLALSRTLSEDDHVYKFEDHDSPQVSRKSTIKNSNSMRVRKLDIFSKKDGSAEEMEFSGNEPSPSGLSGSTKNSSGTEPPKHVFDSLAGDLVDDRGGYDQAFDEDHTATPNSASIGGEQVTASKNHPETYHRNRPLKLKSLTQNTAFSNLRDRSGLSQAAAVADSVDTLDQFDSSSKSSDRENATSSDTYNADRSFDGLPDRHSKDTSELHSNISDYSADAPKQTETNPTQESVIYESKDSTFDQSNSSPVHQEVGIPTDLAASSTHHSSITFTHPSIKRESSLSRSNSELKVQGLAPSSALLRVNNDENGTPYQELELDKRDKRKSMSSISSKSRNLIKRLSFTNSKKVSQDDFEVESQSSNRQRVSSVASIKTTKPLMFTKEELAIMTCNNELQSELLLVTSELAYSIKRELALESRLKSRPGRNDTSDPGSSTSMTDSERAKAIVELQEKLNKERTLRFISEEHAILAEHGQAPSPLKLDYEKNEVYNQLLAKNEMVIQLQDRLDEATASNIDTTGNDLVLRFNELLRENTDLKAKVENCECGQASNFGSGAYQGGADEDDTYPESDQAVILSLKTQRDELREMITKLSDSRNAELKAYHEKTKVLETNLEKANLINQKLSRRLEKPSSSGGAPKFLNGKGGRLQGLSIVSPSQKLFDE